MRLIENLNHCIKNSRLGFTLAEVLITLGIIGVVAAMVIPTLMSNYRKHIIETRVARTYSIISQAVKIAEENFGEGFDTSALKADESIKEVGDANGYSWELSHAAFEKFFKVAIKTNMTYSKQQKQFLYAYSADGTTKFTFSKLAWYDLLDGTRLGFQMSGNYSGIKFIIIPDPNKKKIIVGRDLFYIEFQPVNGAYEYRPSWYRRFLDKTITEDKLVEYCGSNQRYVAYFSGPESYCFQLLKIHSFKIPANYPIKI